MTDSQNIYFLDLEMWCMETYQHYENLFDEPLKRAYLPIWGKIIKDSLDTRFISYEEYTLWVLAGGGDDWFQANK